MTLQDGVIRSINWRDLCPWIELFRVFRISVSIQLLALGFLGAWATPIGWQLSSSICLNGDLRADTDIQRYLRVVGWPGQSSDPHEPSLGADPLPATGSLGHVWDLGRVWDQWLVHTPLFGLVEPMRQWFSKTGSWREYLFFMIGGFWNLMVWAVVGGAITRIAVVRLGRDERVGLRESLVFATTKMGSYVGAPLVPLIAIAVLAVPLFMLGLIMRLNIGIILGGALWGFVGLMGFTMALFTVGVLFGWPLMWSAISAEGSDAFDAISRSFVYTFQRPLHYLFYAVVALTLGLLGWLIVDLFCKIIVDFSMLSVGAGMGAAQTESFNAAIAGTDSGTRRLMSWGSALINWFNHCFLSFRNAYAYSFLWTASAGIYLLLRQNADQTELDEVYVAEDEAIAYGLPPIKIDEAGVPGVDDREATTSNQSASDGDE